MVVITHRPGSTGWEFCSEAGGLQGGGRSLQKCIDASEHAVRQYMSYVGFDVRAALPHQVRHVVSRVPWDDVHERARQLTLRG